ncbi:MAG TPA: aldo/keto reductase [Caulobacteraceae bacterium]
MQTRALGPFTVSAIGLGCMSLSHAYGSPPTRDVAEQVLLGALDAGYTFFDTAALYGFGANETLLGEVLGDKRDRFTLASKCGIFRNADGQREINGRADTLRITLEESLTRLKTDCIDLYYLHRWDKRVPIEESVGALSEFVKEGKIRAIGLSEVSANTLRRAHAVHPVTALQSEYSPWTRNAELGTLQACAELGVAYVAFSPVGRGFLAGGVRSPDGFAERDIRLNMPRFQGENFGRNLGLLAHFEALAKDAGCTPAQLCLAWLLAKGDHVIPIPGTTSPDHMRENAGGAGVVLSAETMAAVDAIAGMTAGHRYAPATLKEIDTEDLAA